MATRTSKRKREAQSAPAEAPGEQSMVAVPATCTFREAAELKANLLRMSGTPAVTIDVSALTRIDAAAMQVLCAFARDRQNESLALQWQGQSAALVEAARLLGLTSALGLPAAA